ncbi:glutamyl-tRNA synthetase [Talaromyces stipitatus ATCC 10500]|uniref:Glutamate--tRNA ligase, mitochondrial n=1 Tax=Talaromyces stipitatus (strain ATCC 10500 / CBS 375.48 / QM 6759 / NRRL 1006) TaxID=441959 RepID=B8MPY1_TALSN|nr:glutamyl-tRNA synthetase [Talaromyces stipitatus ATCC 10500]EED12871.1 glutamyl-tRNA synthetase [Talaromyces stipitatus ATCC 10500]
MCPVYSRMIKLRPGLLTKPSSWICLQCRANSSIASRAPSPSSVRTTNNTRLVPDKPARTRFAPSPTGYLHLGSLRTALFNYLLAKRTGGQFLLRLEDTDQKRTIPGAEERLYSDLQWAGLQWDEGPIVSGPYGPYRQSERTALYNKHANDLVHSGHAYRCFCSAERLDTLARQRNQAGLPLGYDRHCVDISTEEAEERAANGEAHVVRLKADEYPKFKDFVFGTTGQNQDGQKKYLKTMNRVYDDPILLKSDGNPTYHLANVVDDHHMKITHVIRGTEWLASTPMHVALYNAFNWKPPQFGHVPLLVDQNGQKLSKRNSNIDISFYRDSGILPSTLLNYAALLGWSHNQKSEVFSLRDMEEIFTLKITKGNTIVSPEKMWFLQKAHTKRCVADNGPEFQKLVDDVTKAAKERGNITDNLSVNDTVKSLLRYDGGHFTTPAEFLDRNWSFFTSSLNRAPYTLTQPDLGLEDPVSPLAALQTVATILTLVPESHWNVETHRANLDCIPYTSKAFKKELYHYLRWALLGGASGPGMPQIMEVLGRDETVRRLTEATQLNGNEGRNRRGRIKLD